MSASLGLASSRCLTQDRRESLEELPVAHTARIVPSSCIYTNIYISECWGVHRQDGDVLHIYIFQNAGAHTARMVLSSIIIYLLYISVLRVHTTRMVLS